MVYSQKPADPSPITYNQSGIAQVLVLVLLLGGVMAGTYLVQQRTNLLPQAFNQDKYYLEQYPSTDITLPVAPETVETPVPWDTTDGVASGEPGASGGGGGGEGGYPTTSPAPPVKSPPPGKVDGLIYVLLKNKAGKEVNDKNVNFSWTVTNPEIASITPHGKCKLPSQKGECPQNYALIKPLKAGTTQINVSALSKNKNKVLATAVFNLTLTDKEITCKTDKDCKTGYYCMKVYGDGKGCFDDDPNTECVSSTVSSCQPKPSPSCVPAPPCVEDKTGCEIAPPAGKTWCAKPMPSGIVCAQVITRACSPAAIYPPKCQDFPTPCDVPDNWVIQK